MVHGVIDFIPIYFFLYKWTPNTMNVHERAYRRIVIKWPPSRSNQSTDKIRRKFPGNIAIRRCVCPLLKVSATCVYLHLPCTKLKNNGAHRVVLLFNSANGQSSSGSRQTHRPTSTRGPFHVQCVTKCAPQLELCVCSIKMRKYFSNYLQDLCRNSRFSVP